MEYGGFADAGGEAGEVRGEGSGELRGGRGDFVAESMEMFLRGGDGAGVKELLQPRFELPVIATGGLVVEKGGERGSVVRTEGEVEEDDGVGFAFAEVETGTGPAFETEGVGEVILDLVSGAEAGEGAAGGGGEVFGQAGEECRGVGGEGEKRAGFGFGHFFVSGQRRCRGVEVDFGGLADGGLAEGGGEERAGGGEARGKGEGLSDEERADIDGLASSECAPGAGLAAAHFVTVLHVVEDKRGVVKEFEGGGEGDALFGGNLQAFREVEGEAGADAFAGALEDVGGSPAEVTGGAGGVSEELRDERETVTGAGGGVRAAEA